MLIVVIYLIILFGNLIYDSGFVILCVGEVINGYVCKLVIQVQVIVIQFFDWVLVVDCLIVVGEVGYNYFSGVDGDDLCYGCDVIYGIGELLNNVLCIGVFNVVNLQECNSYGFYICNLWGYCLCGIFEYFNVFVGVNLKLNLVWLYDVEGYGLNFSEGVKVVSVGFDVDYQNIYIVSISYIDFFGGNYNLINDCDFFVVSFGVNF